LCPTSPAPIRPKASHTWIDTLMFSDLEDHPPCDTHGAGSAQPETFHHSLGKINFSRIPKQKQRGTSQDAQALTLPFTLG
jgi:hypothetical protein